MKLVGYICSEELYLAARLNALAIYRMSLNVYP